MLRLVYLIVFQISLAQNANILGLFPEQGPSHFIMFEQLMKGLAAKGHNVDVLSHFPQENKIPRYTDLSVKGTAPFYVNNVTINMLEEIGFIGDLLWTFNELGSDLCEPIFNTKIAINLRNTRKKYDVIITELFGTDCMLGFGHLFKIPVIAVTSSVNLPWGSDRFGILDNPSYIPNYSMSYISKMSLIERVINTVTLVATKIGYDMVSMQKSNAAAKRFFGDNLPDLKILAKNISLSLVNSHFSINQARPTVPNFVEVGGLHIGTPQALPKSMEELFDLSNTSMKGVIYFSMGSMVKSDSFEHIKMQALFDAFAEVSYLVIFKSNYLANYTIPNNVHIRKWLPQLDILCHPNTKLFITHGGLMSSQEAIYCGVPRLGIPLFADQELNIRASEQMGIALRVAYKNITKNNIYYAINELLKNPKYKENARSVSLMFKDRPHSALDTAIYWIEYIIRHNGAPHLRSMGSDLPWYQYFLVDVILIIFTFTVLSICISYYLVFLAFKIVYYLFTCISLHNKYKQL